MYKYIFSFITVPVLFIALATPAHAKTPVYQYYQTNTQQQQIAYLYSLVAQLQAQLSALQSYNNSVIYPPYTNNGGSQSTNEISRVVTGGVSSGGDDSINIKGEITFKRDTEARVWFEYGTNTNLSYSTESKEINGDSGDTKDFELTASDLDDNTTYYYRAVAKDDNGNYAEGGIKSFRFDGRNNNDNDNNDSNEDWSLDIADDSYDTGETVRVEYSVDDRSNDNWIGLYEVNASDRNYIARKYVSNDNGYVGFRISNDGEYEFRLFDEDGDKQVMSDEFEVRD